MRNIERVGNYERKFIFKFKHPTKGTCAQPGECGFIIRWSRHKDGNYTLKLVTDSDYYVNTGVHYHDVICARDILCMYELHDYTLEDGTKLEVRAPPYYRETHKDIWVEWLPNMREFNGYYVAYNVKEYMIAE